MNGREDEQGPRANDGGGVFTGIVEDIGRVASLDRREGYQRTVVAAGGACDGLKVGDSVSISGACHTAVAVDGRTFTVESVAETLRRTTMGALKVGSRVNLERSLRAGGRLDGHLVQGHIDGMARVAGRKARGDNTDFAFEVADGLGRYIAEKGSIAVDGISLTVVSVEDLQGARSRFSVTIIPHTLKVTTIGERQAGDAVNIEVDVVARYLERLGPAGPGKAGAGLTMDRLAGAGFDL